MKKKWLPFFLCFVLTAMLLPTAVYADNGPKPSVRVSFQNMGQAPCYGTLLSKGSSTGPASAWRGTEKDVYDKGEGGRPIWEVFQAYADPDGFYFLQWWWPCAQDKPLRWSYYPPGEFKLLLYYPETETYQVSGVYERYAFHSYFTVDVSAPGLLTLEKEGDYAGESLSLAGRMAVTLLVEIGIALLFGLKGRGLLLAVAGVNVATQLLLNGALGWAGYRMGGVELMWTYLLLEMGIFLLEGLAYRFLFPPTGRRKSKRKEWPYALTANLASFLGGALLIRVFPGLG